MLRPPTPTNQHPTSSPFKLYSSLYPATLTSPTSPSPHSPQAVHSPQAAQVAPAGPA